MPRLSAKVCSRFWQVCVCLVSGRGTRVCQHLLGSRSHECCDRVGCHTGGVGMGVESSPGAVEPAAFGSPHHTPTFSDSSCFPRGRLTEDPAEQSSQFSLVQAAKIPAHFFWARLGLLESMEASVGAVSCLSQACEWDDPSDTRTINVQTQSHFGTVPCRPGSASSQGRTG